MTREEAIEKLRLFDFIGSNEDEEFLTALDMAIKALEQEPYEDCISRQAAMDACDQSINYLDATDRIRALPSVTPAQKTGYWIIVNEQAGIYRCGVCNELSCCSSFYCHNCGTKMEVQDEDSN